LYFSRDYTPHDHRFLSALAETEHDVFYLRLERRGHETEDRVLPGRVQIVPWAGGQATMSLRDGPRLLFDMKRVLRRVQPNLIHAGPIQSVGLLAALSGFHPLVIMSWGSDLLLDAHKNGMYRWATRYVLEHCDVFLGDCEAVKQKALGFGVPEERNVTIPGRGREPARARRVGRCVRAAAHPLVGAALRRGRDGKSFCARGTAAP
jgi:hypothetical protein